MQIAIIGAGAAGCFAAANISNQVGTNIVVFEKQGKALQKVKVSGGGRCNTTHSLFDIQELSKRYPRGEKLLRKTLHHFGPQQTIDWFGKRGVRLVAEADGRMFPSSNESQSIIDCIWGEMMRNNVKVLYNKSVVSIYKIGEKFNVQFFDNTVFVADKILITCGGFPKKEQYQWLQELGHTIHDPAPSLFTFNLSKHPITALMGLSVPNATVKILKTKISEKGPLLITHWGLSGPSILRTSAWGAEVLKEKQYDFSIVVNWLGETTDSELKDMILEQRQNNGKSAVVLKNPFEIPKRLWQFFMDEIGISENIKWGDLSASFQYKLIEKLIRYAFHVKGKTTFKEEFVTCGGINLAEIDPNTMESKKVKNLFFAGEILNVDGITGGFNFQHAWTSGWLAARAISTIGNNI